METPIDTNNIEVNVATFAEKLIEWNSEFQRKFDKGDLGGKPTLRVAVVTCMDTRIDTGKLLGVEEGEVHVLRNAGGVVTDDVLRSLVISQHFLDTREIVLVQHTECGMLSFDGAKFKDELEGRVGQRPEFDFHTFSDLKANVRASIRRVESCPFLLHTDSVRGFVYDVKTGSLKEVPAETD